jgi:hypothetical protein
MADEVKSEVSELIAPMEQDRAQRADAITSAPAQPLMEGDTYSQENIGFWTQLPDCVAARTDLSGNAKVLLSMILSLAQRDGICRAGTAFLSEKCGVKQRQILNLLGELSNRQLITGKTQHIAVEFSNLLRPTSNTLPTTRNPLPRSKTVSKTESTTEAVKQGVGQPPSKPDSAELAAEALVLMKAAFLEIRGKQDSFPYTVVRWTCDLFQDNPSLTPAEVDRRYRICLRNAPTKPIRWFLTQDFDSFDVEAAPLKTFAKTAENERAESLVQGVALYEQRYGKRANPSTPLLANNAGRDIRQKALGPGSNGIPQGVGGLHGGGEAGGDGVSYSQRRADAESRDAAERAGRESELKRQLAEFAAKHGMPGV